jgi:hypothetical protein
MQEILGNSAGRGLANVTGQNHDFYAIQASLLIVQASIQVGSLG